MYEDGCDGLPQNIELSIKYIQLAADNGLLAAINKLGELYLFGEVVPVNYKKRYHIFGQHRREDMEEPHIGLEDFIPMVWEDLKRYSEGNIIL